MGIQVNSTHHGRRATGPAGGEGQAQRQPLFSTEPNDQIIREVARLDPKRVLQAIAECDAYISKEGPRNADLRPASVQQHLDHCIQHRATLIAALADAGGAA